MFKTGNKKGTTKHEKKRALIKFKRHALLEFMIEHPDCITEKKISVAQNCSMGRSILLSNNRMVKLSR